MRRMKVASLFCGCGGSDLGLLGGFEYLGKEYKKLNFDIVYAIDFDKHAVETYNSNFEHKAICGDIKEVDFNSIPDVDAMIGGFPCQSFSTVNPTKDVNDDRANLYKEIVRFLTIKRPKYFICENVKGLLTLQKGGIISKISNEFKEVGYNVKYQLVRAVDFGIPQRRERVLDFPCLTITSHLAKTSMNSRDPILLVDASKELYRRFTPREAARIQSFPDSFVLNKSEPKSYKQIGNAIPPVLMWHIAYALQKMIEEK